MRWTFGLIVGFLAVDLVFFHDIFKAGEVATLPQYMTGFLLSIAVLVICAQSLAKSGRGGLTDTSVGRAIACESSGE